jgi:ATP-binding cassette subfamily B protein
MVAWETMLLSGNTPVARWRYTLGHAGAAHRLARRFKSLVKGPGAVEDESRTTVCPSCGAVLDADEVECPHCRPELAAPSRYVLWRLASLARPWLPVITLGFLLTMASTGTSMIAPYLTKPLLDDVLIPHQQARRTRSTCGWSAGTYSGLPVPPLSPGS